MMTGVGIFPFFGRVGSKTRKITYVMIVDRTKIMKVHIFNFWSFTQNLVFQLYTTILNAMYTVQISGTIYLRNKTILK